MDIHKGKIKIIITFAILFLAVSILLLVIFLAGKKTYVVEFDLDGGTLISGSLEQHVTQGQDAVPPTVVKEGAYLRSWSTSYKKITKDKVIRAIWEYETTPGIMYAEHQNFAEVSGSYQYIRGEIYLGAYYGDKKVLGILDSAFANRTGITKVYLLDGLISIGSNAFSGCSGLTEIEIPETVTHIGSGAFRNCQSLETLVLNEGLLEIGSNAFSGCEGLKEVVLPASVVRIDANAFAGCENLIIRTKINKDQKPETWSSRWQGKASVLWADSTEPEAPSKDDTIIKFPDRPILRPGISISPSDKILPSLDLEKAFKDLLEKKAIGGEE